MNTLRPAERLFWHRGAALLNQDLADWAAYEPELLALHVRAAHGTWGIASGLTVAVTSNQRSVAVSRGVAFTCSGRVIALQKATVVPAPKSGSGTYDIVLVAPRGATRSCGGKAPPCSDAPVVEHATLEWRSPKHAQHCTCQHCGPAPDRIPLARLVRHTNGTLADLSYDVRPIARSRNRPAIGRGSVSAADLNWQDGPLSLRATIDTRDAEFTSTPLYFASLHELRPLGTRAIGPWLTISGAARKAFLLTLRFGAKPTMSASALNALVRPKVEKSTVVWFGVDQHTGCGGPSIDIDQLLPTLTGPIGGGS
jgi:hypothetical protein